DRLGRHEAVLGQQAAAGRRDVAARAGLVVAQLELRIGVCAATRDREHDTNKDQNPHRHTPWMHSSGHTWTRAPNVQSALHWTTSWLLQAMPPLISGLHCAPGACTEIHSSSSSTSRFGIGASNGMRPMPRPNGSIWVIQMMRFALSGLSGSYLPVSNCTSPPPISVRRTLSGVSS